MEEGNKMDKPTIFKSLEAALEAADKDHPYGYYGKNACEKLTCMECGAVYYGYLGSNYSENPYCECGVNDFWKREKIYNRKEL